MRHQQKNTIFSFPQLYSYINKSSIHQFYLPKRKKLLKTARKVDKNCFFSQANPRKHEKKNVTNTQTRKTQKTTTFPRKKPRPETNRNKPVKPDSTSTSTDQPDRWDSSTEGSSHRGTIRLLELPAKESRNKKVSFEDRKGTTSWSPNSMGIGSGKSVIGVLGILTLYNW